MNTALDQLRVILFLMLKEEEKTLPMAILARNWTEAK
jgi:hypothetical protein